MIDFLTLVQKYKEKDPLKERLSGCIETHEMHEMLTSRGWTTYERRNILKTIELCLERYKKENNK